MSAIWCGDACYRGRQPEQRTQINFLIHLPVAGKLRNLATRHFLLAVKLQHATSEQTRCWTCCLLCCHTTAAFALGALLLPSDSFLYITIFQRTIPARCYCSSIIFISVGTKETGFLPGCSVWNNHPTSCWPHFIFSPKPIFAGIWSSVGNRSEWWPEHSVAAASKPQIPPGRNIKAKTWNCGPAACKTANGHPDWGLTEPGGPMCKRHDSSRTSSRSALQLVRSLPSEEVSRFKCWALKQHKTLWRHCFPLISFFLTAGNIYSVLRPRLWAVLAWAALQYTEQKTLWVMAVMISFLTVGSLLSVPIMQFTTMRVADLSEIVWSTNHVIISWKRWKI